MLPHFTKIFLIGLPVFWLVSLLRVLLVPPAEAELVVDVDVEVDEEVGVVVDEESVLVPEAGSVPPEVFPPTPGGTGGAVSLPCS